MPGKIFVSYASERRDVAEPIALALRSAGYDVFFDRDDLPAGQSYHDQIAHAINETDVMVFLLSPESVDKGRYTLSEVGLARKKWRTPKGRVLPVMLAPTPLEELPAYLREVSILDTQGNVVADTVSEVNTLVDAIQQQNAKRTLSTIVKASLGALVIGLGGWFAWPQIAKLSGNTQPAEMTEGRQISRTPNLGLQFLQQGQIANMRLFDDEADERYGEVVVALARSAFEIRVPESHWPNEDEDYPALQIAVSDSRDIFDMMQFDQDRRETPYLGDGSGMADNVFGSGALISYHSEYEDCCWGHNYIIDERFNASGREYRGMFISQLHHRVTQEDFVQSKDSVFLSVYLNNDEQSDWSAPDPLSVNEVEWIELRFID